MSRPAGVPTKIVWITIANLLRQRPDAIAFLEGILEPGRAGRAILHVKDGQMIDWGFDSTPRGIGKRIDGTKRQAVK